MLNPIEVSKKYGIAHPLFTQQGEDPMAKVNNQIGNYKTRIGAIGEAVPAPEHKMNWFLKTLMLLDRPRAALWNGINEASKVDGDGFLKGASDGFTGKKNYTGRQMVRDMGVKNKTAQGLLGFGAEVLGDPLNLVTFGAGSLAKGAITGATKAVTVEGAQAAARAALKGVTEEGATLAAKRAFKEAGIKKFTEEQLSTHAKEILHSQANEVLAKHGTQLDDILKTADPKTIIANSVVKYADAEIQNSARTAGRGLSIGTRNHNISLISDEKLQGIGAKVSDAINGMPVIGKAAKALQETTKAIFDPKYIHGLDTVTQEGIYNIKQGAYGMKNVADNDLTHKFDLFSRELGKLGVDDARAQDRLITKVLEGTAKPEELKGDIAKLINGYTDTNGKFITGIKHDLEAWGVKEKDLGVLKSMYDENYFPHVLSWEGEKALAKGGLTEKLKLYDPFGKYREHGATVASANRVMKFLTSSHASQEEYIRSVYELGGKEMPNKIPNSTEFKEFLDEHGIAQSDVDKIGDDLLDGKNDFFETSAVKGYLTRGLSHNKIVADKEILDGVTAAFGTKVLSDRHAKDLMKEGKDIIVAKSSLRAFMLDLKQHIDISRGVKEAGGKKVAQEGMSVQGLADDMEATLKLLPADASAVIKKLIADTPEAFVKISPEDYKTLVSHEGQALFARQNLIEAYGVPHGVVEAVNGASKRQIDAGKQAIGKAIDAFYGVWKPTVTGLSPNYHIRNFVGSNINNMLNIGFRTLDPVLQRDAARVAFGGGEGAIELAGTKIPIKELRDAMLQTHANTNLQISEFTNQASAHVARYEKNIGGTVNSVMKDPLSAISKPGEIAGKAIENDVRSVNFLANVTDGLEKGMTKEQAYKFAGEQVNKYHFNYAELTSTERDIFRRIAPFYTWMRKNLPLQMEQFLNNPAFYTGIPKFQRNMEEAQGIDSSNMPEWFQNQMPLPLGGLNDKGVAPYANISAPQADIGNATSDPLKYLIGSLNPLFKTAIETQQNRSMLTGAPIYKNEAEKSQKLLENAINQFGAVRDLKNAAANVTGNGVDASGRAVQPGLGIVKGYSPQEAANDATYAYNRQLGNKVQELNDKYGDGFVPSTADSAQYENLSPAIIEIIKRTGIVPPYIKHTQMATIAIDDTPNYSAGYRARYLNKVSGSSKQITFEKALNAAMKNGGL